MKAFCVRLDLLLSDFFGGVPPCLYFFLRLEFGYEVSGSNGYDVSQMNVL